MAMNHYLHVFFESIWAASIVPFSSHATFFAMKSFGGFNLPMAAALAIAGAILGQCFNWLVGRAMANYKKSVSHQAWYGRVSVLFTQYGVFLLVFCWIPLGNLLVVLAGLLNARLRIVLPLVAVGELYHYGQYLL